MKKQPILELKGWTITTYCHCAVCNKAIGLNGTHPDFPSLGWFDPYNKTHYIFKEAKGCYVCFEHISDKRKQEIAEEEKAHAPK